MCSFTAFHSQMHHQVIVLAQLFVAIVSLCYQKTQLNSFCERKHTCFNR